MAKNIINNLQGKPPGITTEAGQGPIGKRIATIKYLYEEPITYLLRHYILWVNDMNTRRTRKNGWNDIISAGGRFARMVASGKSPAFVAYIVSSICCKR